ncbi:hypothetical protein [Prochlorococcus sp. MIT 1307]|uniref:hypothetical protein n=1 Tax=Prochlorococcus sp. MIT 1307 TaxID=3096219 RepID=UPI002A74D0F3|nr:hypothetical protein [Prochlorococcus sp. MIT 1307]
MKILNLNPRNNIILLTFFLSSAFICVSLICIFSGYSYWGDEIFSISASSDNWVNLFINWILPDTHPPLYQILLKIWIDQFGNFESSTRTLSLIFSSCTLGIFIHEALRTRSLRRFFNFLLVLTAPSFIYYSQESRNYSLLLLLASTTTIFFLRLRENVFSHKLEHNKAALNRLNAFYYLSTILLSLTHYFGLIYAYLMAILNYFDNKVEPKRWKIICLICLISIWPVLHNVGNSNLNRIGWITILPIVGTINEYLIGCIPLLAYRDQTSIFIWIVSCSIVAFSIILYFKRKHVKVIPNSKVRIQKYESIFILTLILLFLAALAVIDLRVSLSTPRNYIVLLPATTILISNFFAYILSVSENRSFFKRLLTLIFSLMLIGNIAISYAKVKNKTMPLINFKSFAEYLRESNICNKGCLAIDLPEYYFGDLDNLTPVARNKVVDELKNNSELNNKIILYYGNPSDHTSQTVRKREEALCLQPRQSISNSLFISIHNDDQTAIDNEMIDCLN